MGTYFRTSFRALESCFHLPRPEHSPLEAPGSCCTCRDSVEKFLAEEGEGEVGKVMWEYVLICSNDEQAEILKEWVGVNGRNQWLRVRGVGRSLALCVSVSYQVTLHLGDLFCRAPRCCEGQI